MVLLGHFLHDLSTARNRAVIETSVVQWQWPSLLGGFNAGGKNIKKEYGVFSGRLSPKAGVAVLATLARNQPLGPQAVSVLLNSEASSSFSAPNHHLAV
jgi:hypothetical protein